MKLSRAALVGLLVAVPLLWQQEIAIGPDLRIGPPGKVQFARKTSPNSDPDFDPTDYEAVWTMGPDGALNSATWETGPGNMLESSGDMTGAAFSTQGTITIDDATHATFGAQYSNVRQARLTSTGIVYTFYLRARIVSGNTSLVMFHENSATGDYTAKTFTGTEADYAVTVLGRSGGGAVNFGIQDRNASGFGQIEVTRWAVLLGTHTASEAAAAYIKTDDNQDITDWSGNGNTLTRGPTSSAETNDPSNLMWSRNVLAAGSGNNLTTGWTALNVTPSTTYFVETTADSEHRIYQNPDLGASVARTMVASAELASYGGRTWAAIRLFDSAYKGAWFNLSTGVVGTEEAGITASITDLGGGYYKCTVSKDMSATATPYMAVYSADADASVSFVGDTGKGLYVRNAQFEQTISGVTNPTPFTSPAEPTFVCASCDFDGTDDYNSAGNPAGLQIEGDATYLLLYRTTTSSSKRLLSKRDGTNSQADLYVLNAGTIAIYLHDGVAGGAYSVITTSGITDGGWHIIGIAVDYGNVVTGYFDTAAEDSPNISAITGSIKNTTANFLISAYPAGTNTFNGDLAFVAVKASLMDSTAVSEASCQIAAMAWDYRAIPIHGADSACSEFDLTVAPQYAYLTPFELDRKLRGEIPILAQILQLPGLEVRH